MYCSRAGGGTVTDISALLFGLNFVFSYLLPGHLLDPAGHLLLHGDKLLLTGMLIVIVWRLVTLFGQEGRKEGGGG